MSFLENLRQRAIENEVSPVVIGSVISQLEKKGAVSKDFLSKLQSHGPPLVIYAVEIIKYRSGKIGVEAAQQQLHELAKKIDEDFLIELNRQIVEATRNDSLVSQAKTRRYHS